MKKRSAISPVLATVVLIAITLIAAFAVAGFVFGLFGSFESPPMITASAMLLSQFRPAGTITLYNSGSSAATVVDVRLTYNGQTCHALYYAPGPAPSAGSVNVQIQQGQFPTQLCGQPGTTSTPQPGMQFTGQAVVNGGGQIPFTGTFG